MPDAKQRKTQISILYCKIDMKNRHGLLSSTLALRKGRMNHRPNGKGRRRRGRIITTGNTSTRSRRDRPTSGSTTSSNISYCRYMYMSFLPSRLLPMLLATFVLLVLADSIDSKLLPVRVVRARARAVSVCGGTRSCSSRRHSLVGRYCRHVVRDTIRQQCSAYPRRSIGHLLQSAAIRSLSAPKHYHMYRYCAIGCGIAAASFVISANDARAAAAATAAAKATTGSTNNEATSVRVPTSTTATAAARTARISPLEPTIRAIKFWRRVGPVVMHYKFTQAWFKLANVDPAVRSDTWDRLHAMHAPASLDVILELRGLFVKIGQVMSSRADFVPRQYVDCFHTLQDAVPPWETERVEAIVRESLRTTQNVDFEDVFESFGEVLGSASIGQVHKATLTPKYASIGGYTGGKTVAVKVMHPDAEFRFRNDFKIFRALCKVALPGWDPILRELEQQMMTEFDYNNEAHNLEVIRNNMAKSPYANKVRIPQPAKELCSNNLLVMEYLSGKKLAVAIEERLASILGGDVTLARKVLKAKQQALFEAKDISNNKERKGFLTELSNMVGKGNDMSILQKGTKMFQVLSMTKDARNKLSLLLDATGHQIFQDGVYNGENLTWFVVLFI